MTAAVAGEHISMEARVVTSSWLGTYNINAVLKLTLFRLSQDPVFSFVQPIEKKKIM